MATTLPAATDLTGANRTQGEVKIALTQLIAYLSEHLGDTVIPSGPLSGFRNVIINGNFNVNQRVYASGAAVGSGLYGHDRWKMASSGDTYTFSTTNNVTTVTIPAGKVLQQVIEGINLQSGTYVLSWTGTAQGKIGVGSYGASGITGTATGGTNLTIEFGPGTVSKVQFEFGSTPTPFEARPVGVELALCQRYYETGSFAVSNNTNHIYLNQWFKVVKRAAPTVTVAAGGATWIGTPEMFYNSTVSSIITNTTYTASIEL